MLNHTEVVGGMSQGDYWGRRQMFDMLLGNEAG